MVREAGFEPAMRVAQRVYSPPSVPIGHLHAWCDRRDSNPHGLAATPSRGARYTKFSYDRMVGDERLERSRRFDGRFWAGWVFQFPQSPMMFDFLVDR
jgi:hypothetical protein